MDKQVIPRFQPDRAETLDKIAKKIVNNITEDYDISALDFIQIMEHTKNTGLKQSQL